MFFTALFAAVVSLKGHLLEVEVADTLVTRNKGLSGRSELAKDHGMLFIWEDERAIDRMMWMKDMKISISVAFLNRERQIIKMADLDPPTADHIPSCVCDTAPLYALEVPQGWFAEHNIQLGDTLEFSAK
jgi:hypothetical protein